MIDLQNWWLTFSSLFPKFTRMLTICRLISLVEIEKQNTKTKSPQSFAMSNYIIRDKIDIFFIKQRKNALVNRNVYKTKRKMEINCDHRNVEVQHWVKREFPVTPEHCFLHVSAHTSHLEGLAEYGLWFSVSGVALRLWCWWCQSPGTQSNKALQGTK